MGLKRDTIRELSEFFEPRNVFGWFLSIRGLDAEFSILRLLRVIDDRQIFDRSQVWHYKLQILHREAHRLGVGLLAPRHEKLHFKGAGLTKRPSSSSSELSLTPERCEKWTKDFKTLATNLRCVNVIYSFL